MLIFIEKEGVLTNIHLKKRTFEQLLHGTTFNCNYIYLSIYGIYYARTNELRATRKKRMLKLPKRAHVLFAHDVERAHAMFQPLQRGFVAETDLEIFELGRFTVFSFVASLFAAAGAGLRKGSRERRLCGEHFAERD